MWVGVWVAGSNDNITISTQVKVGVKVGVELSKITENIGKIMTIPTILVDILQYQTIIGDA